MADNPHLKIENGSQVAVIGSGPAGAFFTYFFLDLAERSGQDVHVDVYDAKDFSRMGPAGCNHCGGIISESLVQILSAEGVKIPADVVLRGIDAYLMHTDKERVRIETPLDEKRIAAMHRGGGPLGGTDNIGHGFDGFLQDLIQTKNAQLIKERVKHITGNGGRPVLETKGGTKKTYDLVVGATGINTNTLALFEGMGFGYQPPKGTKTYICEFRLGSETVQRYFGSAMHVFLLNISRLEFAALIPKGDCVTLCLLGEGIDKPLIQTFLSNPEVRNCFPPEWDFDRGRVCQCYPKINIKGAIQPFADRVVLIGDCGVTKLYKNGIGAAYITAKAAATTAVLQGISHSDFKRHYWPACRGIRTDNAIGKVIFALTGIIKKSAIIKRGIIRMVIKEQRKNQHYRAMSTVLWDTFTGNAPYREIMMRAARPSFLATLTWEILRGIFSFGKEEKIFSGSDQGGDNDLGKVYRDGETIIKQGDEGDCLYVIRSGKVEVIRNENDRPIFLAELGEGDFFGEMALFEREIRSTTVRARGEVRLITVDKRALLRRIQEDPSLAFRILEKMSSRVREDNRQILRVKSTDRRNWETRPDRQPDPVKPES